VSGGCTFQRQAMPVSKRADTRCPVAAPSNGKLCPSQNAPTRGVRWLHLPTASCARLKTRRHAVSGGCTFQRQAVPVSNPILCHASSICHKDSFFRLLYFYPQSILDYQYMYVISTTRPDMSGRVPANTLHFILLPCEVVCYDNLCVRSVGL